MNEFSVKEREFLLHLLRERLGTQREQIYHSDTPAFKDQLRAEEELLRRLIEKVSGDLSLKKLA